MRMGGRQKEVGEPEETANRRAEEEKLAACLGGASCACVRVFF